MSIEIRERKMDDDTVIKSLLDSHWGGRWMAVHSECIDLCALPGWLAFINTIREYKIFKENSIKANNKDLPLKTLSCGSPAPKGLASPSFLYRQLAGLLTYRLSNGQMEIMSLDSLVPNRGVGSALLKKAVDMAKAQGVSRLHLTTTNDNTHALRFYQKRGFSLSAIRLGAVAAARKLKPSIPEVDEEGVPIEHELELDYRF